VDVPHVSLSLVFLSSFTDHMAGNTSLDVLLALLQTEGAKIEEETEVRTSWWTCDGYPPIIGLL